MNYTYDSHAMAKAVSKHTIRPDVIEVINALCNIADIEPIELQFMWINTKEWDKEAVLDQWKALLEDEVNCGA